MTQMLLALALLIATPAEAIRFFKTGDELWQICIPQTRECLVYVMGVVDGWDMFRGMGADDCLPKAIAAGQITEIVVQWLARHPQYRHYSGPAPVLIILAIFEAFPQCAGAPTGR